MRLRRLPPAPLALAALLVSGCAARQPEPAALAERPAPTAPAAPAFAGYGNLAVPPRLADGAYATPNRNLSPAATIWHLRAGLNVAALSCRGADEAPMIAGYNMLLQRQRAALDAAHRAVDAEYRDAAAFDGAMTALYNYYALPPAQAGLCAAAREVLAQAAILPPDALPAFAPAALARLDQPYVAMFARQEAWLNRGSATIAAVSAPAISDAPRLAVDPAVLRIP